MKPLPLIATLLVGALALAAFLLIGKPTEGRGEPQRTLPLTAEDTDPQAGVPAALTEGVRSAEGGSNPERSRIGTEKERAAATTPKEARASEASNAGKRARIVGRCVDTLLQPLAGVLVECIGRDLTATSDESGRFTLDVDLQARVQQSLRLRIEKEGRGGTQLVVALRLGKTTDLGDVLLRATGSLAGRVVDGEGRPLAGARVQVEEALDVARGNPFRGAQEPLLEGECDARGAFRFDAVPVGSLRVWAGAPDSRWSVTDTLVLLPFKAVEDILLEVVALDPEDTIELLVLEPDGAPASEADVSFRYSVGYQSGTGSVPINESGVGRLFLDIRAQYSFLANDKDRRFRPAVARDVAPGTRDLILQLAETKTFLLRVKDDGGQPVDEFSARVIDAAEEYWGTTVPRDAEQPQGELVVVSPVFEFRIKVDAEGFELAELGPYDPENMPAVVDVRLEALPGIRGRVLSGDGVVARARVSLHRAISADRSYVMNGFPARSEGHGVESRADMQGEFALTLREAGTYYLRAEAPGFAPGELGPLELDPTVGASGVELHLAGGGSLAGRVLVFAGEELAGHIVGISRGDGFGVTGRTDANGEFRFDGLLPGRWLVEWRQDEIRSNYRTSTSGSVKEPVEIPWNCEVRLGQTTRYELDLRTLRGATLDGEFLLAGSAPEDWRATLSLVGGAGQETRQATLDSRGRFSISTSALGASSLNLVGLTDRTSFVRVSDTLDMEPGNNVWSFDLAAGAIEGSIAGSSVAPDSVIIEREGEARPTFEVRVVPSAAGDFRISRFPVGPAVIRWRTLDGSSMTRTVTVAADAIRQVTIP